MHLLHSTENPVPLVVGIHEALCGFRALGLTDEAADLAGQRLALRGSPRSDHRAERSGRSQSLDNDINGLVVLRGDKNRLSPADCSSHCIQDHLRFA